MSFTEKVLEITSQIPSGQTLTYKEVARLAGNPKAARAVGNILNKNYNPAIPCHRVIRSDGKPGGYNRGCAEKIKKLKEEDSVPQCFLHLKHERHTFQKRDAISH